VVDKITLYQPKIVRFNGNEAVNVGIQVFDTKHILYEDENRQIEKQNYLLHHQSLLKQENIGMKTFGDN
jgi:hypothetical protein